MSHSTGKRQPVQNTTEFTPDLVPNTSIVVIHPGSCNLRLGLASDAFPHLLPHCIAYRHKSSWQQTHYEDMILTFPQSQLGNNKQQMRAGLQMAQETIQHRPTSLGTYRQATSSKRLSEMNSVLKAEKSDVLSPVMWTSTVNKPEFLVGKEALYTQPSDCYNLHWPIQRGRLNIHSNGPNGTLTAVLLQLERIWGYAMETYLSIPSSRRKNYKAVLLIPDIYNRQHVREMINILLNGLGFNAAFVVQESVCATLGAGISSACVVDIGDQKTSVCCVEDGLSQKNTRVCMEYGGCDISRCFHWLITRAGFPYKHCNITDRMDALLLQELKETYCHLDQDLVGTSDVHIQVRPPGCHIVSYTMQLADERLLAPMAIFHPDMFDLPRAAHVLRVAEKYRSDPSDPHDDDYLVQTQSRHEQVARLIAARKRENAEAASQNTDDLTMDDDDTMDHSECSTSDVLNNTGGGTNGTVGSTGVKQAKKADDEDEGVNLDNVGLLGLDQAILGSIEKCENDDMKKRMYSCVVVVGGGLAFLGCQSWLQYLLWIQMPPHVRLSLETMDVYTRPKDLDPTLLCWKGGAVICCLDTAQELWISQAEWRQLGVKILRERAPFVW
ncbi:Actin-related protein 8 [Lamellibrachia satsuma]|nr:Actin-related protein 8 [Lamellibrachia satsuma]